MTFFIKVTPSHWRKLVKVRRTRPQLWKRCSGLVCALRRSHYHLGKRERGKDRERERERGREARGWNLNLCPISLAFFLSGVSAIERRLFRLFLPVVRWLGNPPAGEQTHLVMDALKSAGRAIIKSPGVPRHTWGTSKHESEWDDTNVWKRLQFCKDSFFFFMWRSGSIICQIGSMKGGQCVPLAARSKLVDLLFYCSGAFVCPSAKSKRHSCTVTSCFIMLLTLSCHIIRNTSTVLSLLLCDMELMLPEAPYQHKWLLRASISSLPV